jgi:hypothetical protein
MSRRPTNSRVTEWLGGKDSNLRMPGPKPGALPAWRPPSAAPVCQALTTGHVLKNTPRPSNRRSAGNRDRRGLSLIRVWREQDYAAILFRLIFSVNVAAGLRRWAIHTGRLRFAFREGAPAMARRATRRRRIASQARAGWPPMRRFAPVPPPRRFRKPRSRCRSWPPRWRPSLEVSLSVL